MGKYDVLNNYTHSNVGISMGRSKFNLSSEHLTTFSSGYWFPVHCVEVLPGDTFEVTLNQLVRMLTPVVPTMDNAILELAAFFVPNRLCTRGEHDWEQICVGAEPDAWTNGFDKDLITTQNVIHINNDSLVDITSGNSTAIQAQSLASYLGLPIGDHLITNLSLLPFNAVLRIWNEWLRDENTMESIDLSSWMLEPASFRWITEDLAETSGSAATNFLRASKLKDLFTSALPAPQKGGAVFVPIGDRAPIGGNLLVESDNGFGTQPRSLSLFTEPFAPSAGEGAGNTYGAAYINQGSSTDTGSDNVLKIRKDAVNGLYADLSQAVGASVNAIRLSFALQRLQEKLARGGSRYNEFLKSVFGVEVNPGMVQMSEFLGGTSTPINVTQVLQTSATNEVSPLGSTGAFSNTYSHSDRIVKSFVEYGYFVVMATVRPTQSYSQGIPKMFRRMSPLDIYSPTFAFIGEQPIFTEELYYNSETALYDPDDGSVVNAPVVFGYKEAWSEYKNPVKRISGNFAPAAGDLTLASWTYTTNFTDVPRLSSGFIEQPMQQIGNTLIDVDTNTQFIGDFVANITAIRPMPAFDIPGLIDHF